MTAAPLTQGGGSSGGGTTNIISTNTTNSVTITSKIGTVQTASVVTPNLSTTQSYETSIATSTSFVPLLISVSSPARVELYATANAQIADFLRLNTNSPGPGTEQGIFLDVTIDSSPFTWLVTPTLPASNADNPQAPVSYITITNVGTGTAAITVSVQYLVLQL